jgi:hypothetical protein
MQPKRQRRKSEWDVNAVGAMDVSRSEAQRIGDERNRPQRRPRDDNAISTIRATTTECDDAVYRRCSVVAAGDYVHEKTPLRSVFRSHPSPLLTPLSRRLWSSLPGRCCSVVARSSQYDQLKICPFIAVSPIEFWVFTEVLLSFRHKYKTNSSQLPTYPLQSKSLVCSK